MLHPADGTLRRFHDEPRALDSVRAHLEGCGQCRGRLAALADAADAAEGALLPSEPTPIDSRTALAVVRARALAETAGAVRFARPQPAFWKRRFVAPLGGLAAVAALVVLVAFTPLGTVAQNFLAIFEPRQFVAIPVTHADLEQLRALPDLDAYGVVRQGPQPALATVANPRAAAFLAGSPVRVPTWLPANTPRVVSYHVMGRTTGVFTFSAARATLAASAAGKPLPPMPPRLDGSSLVATIGPIVLTTYGVQQVRTMRRHAIVRAGRRGGGDDGHMFMMSGSVLLIAQAPVPRVSSTGASVREIESFLLKQPGVPPQLAAEIAAIGDPATTMPIPIPIDREVAERVIVQGVPGLGVLDNTGIGSAVLWQRDGVIYAVAGTLTARELLAVANSLR